MQALVPSSSSPELSWPKETPAAMQAFEQYLGLPVPRDVGRMAPFRPKGRNGQLSERAYTLGTLRGWQAKYKWIARAELLDQQVQKKAAESYISWKAEQRMRRERSRIAVAEGLRAQAIRYLNAGEKLPADLKELEARYVEIALKMLKQADDTERLDLGGVTERVERVDPQEPRQVELRADRDTIEALRDIVNQLPERKLQDVIDVTPEPTTTPYDKLRQLASKNDEPISDAELMGEGDDDAPDFLYDGS